MGERRDVLRSERERACRLSMVLSSREALRAGPLTTTLTKMEATHAPSNVQLANGWVHTSLCGLDPFVRWVGLARIFAVLDMARSCVRASAQLCLVHKSTLKLCTRHLRQLGVYFRSPKVEARILVQGPKQTVYHQSLDDPIHKSTLHQVRASTRKPIPESSCQLGL
jgi:hypothetical protein